MKTSTQSKFLIQLVCYMGIGFLIGLIMLETQSKILWLVLLGWTFLASYLMFKVKCPSCRMPVVYQGKVMGISFYAGICKSTCANCGYDLTKVEK